MAETMKALVKKKAEKGLWLETVPVPKVGINDCLVQVLRTGICGTDVHIYNWDSWAAKTIPTPMVVGHEFVGKIVEVGSNVHDFHVGDIVSGEGHVVCGHCRNCLAGRRHLCKDTKGIGVNRPGAFAEYIALPVSNVWVHDSVDAEHASHISRDVQAIFDPFGNAVHTALSFDVLGEDVLITGAGPIGCMAAAVVKHAGARFVVVTDVNPYRLELAKKLGADLAVDVRTETLQMVQKRLGMKEGFDVGLEMSGNPTAFRDLLANMAHGGRIAMLGIPEKETAIDWKHRHFQHAHDQGDLRPGDVRDVVQDDRDAPERAKARAGDHAPLRVPGFSKRVRRDAQRAERKSRAHVGRGVSERLGPTEK